MGILATAMSEHLANCAAAGYHAPERVQCPFLPPTANDAWTIGRWLHAHGMPPPRSIEAGDFGSYHVDGVTVKVASSGAVQLQQ